MSILVWADVPVTDLDRARRFYSQVLGVDVPADPNMPGIALVMGDPPSVDLALNMGQPSETAGTTIYFGTTDLDAMLARVEPAGGRILQPKQFMGDMVGYIAFFLDTEGNRVGLRSSG